MAITSGYTPLHTSYDRSNINIPQIPSVKPHSQTGGSTAKPQAEPQEQSTHEASGTSNTEHESVTDNYDMPEHTASSTSNDDTLQDEVLHDSSAKKSINKRKVPTVKRKVTKDTIQIRDFPRDVMDIIRGVVPGGNSYVETLLAYIYVTCPTKFDIPSNVQEIVDAYEQDDALTQVFREIRLLREQIRNVEVTTYQNALASEYSLFSELGLRKDTATNPSDINYLEPGVEDMHIALEETAKQLKKKDTIRHGRR